MAFLCNVAKQTVINEVKHSCHLWIAAKRSLSLIGLLVEIFSLKDWYHQMCLLWCSFDYFNDPLTQQIFYTFAYQVVTAVCKVNLNIVQHFSFTILIFSEAGNCE